MRGTIVRAVGVAASIGLIAACAAPAKDAGTSGTAKTTDGGTIAAALDPTAKGPAPEVAGAKKGGILTVSYATAPSDMDPSAQFYQDSGIIMTRLTQRSLTSFVTRDGNQVLVPDLATDLGKTSPDGLTWTFTLKDGIKYSDGSPVYLMPSLRVKVQVRPSGDVLPRSVARSGTSTWLPSRVTNDVSDRWVSRVMMMPESW